MFLSQLFLRGKPHLQKYMRRLPKTHKKLPMKKKDEPDFYKLDQSNPLPQVHEAPIPGAAATVQAMRASGSTLMGGNGLPSSMPHPSSPQVITPPHLSPNQPGPNLINGGSSSMMGPNDGLGSIGGMMSGMGRSSMGMGEFSMPGAGSRTLPPRYGGAGGYDSYGMSKVEDDYDLHRPRLGRNDSGNNGHYGGQSGYNTSVSSPYGGRGGPSDFRRSSGRGDHSMFDRGSSSPSEYYGGGFSQHQMMPPMQSQALYGRGSESAHDDYPSPPHSNLGSRR